MNSGAEISVVLPLILSILIPAFVSGIIFLLARQPWKSGDRAATGVWAAGLAIAAAFNTGYFIMLGKPEFPPVSGYAWLLYAVPVALIVGFMSSIFPSAWWVKWILPVLLAVALPIVVLQTNFKYRWSVVEGSLWVGAIAAVMLILWKSTDAILERTEGGSVPLALLIVAAGSVGVIALSHSALVGQLSGVLSAALGAIMVLAFIRPKVFSLDRSATPVLITILAGLWMNGYFYADVPPLSAILLALSPLLLWTGELRGNDAKPWKIALIRVAAVALLVIAALGLVVMKELQSGPPDYY